MTVPWMLTMSKKCNWRWTDSQLLATTSVSPSAAKKQKWCASSPQETHTKNLTLQWKGRDSRPWRTTHTLAAHANIANIDAEVNNRIAKASSAFGKLKTSVWEWQGISHRKSTEQPCYPLSSTAAKPRLSTGDMRKNSTSFISGVYAAFLTSTGRTRSRTPKHWTGHGSPASSPRCERHRHAGQVTSSEWQTSRKAGGQRKYFKDSLKAYLKDFNIDITTWENVASDWPAWRNMVHRGALHSEVQRSNAAKEIRWARKARAENSIITPPTLWCHPWHGLPCPHRSHQPSMDSLLNVLQCASDMVKFVIESTNNISVVTDQTDWQLFMLALRKSTFLWLQAPTFPNLLLQIKVLRGHNVTLGKLDDFCKYTVLQYTLHCSLTYIYCTK